MKLDAEVYPNEQVAHFITDNFIPVRLLIKEKQKDFQRFNAQWTPTILLMNSDGAEKFRIEGFLPADDFLAQLELGLGRIRFEEQKYQEAQKLFKHAYEAHPQATGAPEAIYWAGVSEYKATNNAEPLKRTSQTLKLKHPQSEWAKKASVWG